MGIYDRDYYQGPSQPRGITLGGGGMMLVNRLVIINVVIFLIDAVIPPGHALSDFLALKSDLYLHPWHAYQLLTYGFAHAPLGSQMGIWHVGMNMFMLWMFGREVELRLGRKEFLTYYIVAILFAGSVWLVTTDMWLFSTPIGAVLREADKPVAMLGASGGVMAVLILFILYDPHRTLYIWGLIGVPAWLIGIFIVGIDLMRGFQVSTDSQDHVAWQAHLAGAGLAFFYYRYRWNLSRFLPDIGGLRIPRLGPKLKVHDPDQDDAKFAAEADRVLDKVHREGLDSLTARDRRILETHSRQLRQRRGR